MKLFRFAMLVLVTALLAAGCTKPVAEGLDGDPVTVTLNITGDFDVDVEQDPLTRGTSTNDAYAINVYYDKEGNGTQDDKFAYGLFDNTSDMVITLLSGHKYKFQCTLVKDARNTLFFGQAFNNAYSGYAFPFQTSSSNSTMITNRFIAGTGTYFTGMTKGSAHTASITTPSTDNAVANASVNRFLGTTSNYVPVPNGVVNIHLKRVVFGAKFVISGLAEGSVKVTCGNFFNRTYSSNNAGTEKIYTLTTPGSETQKETVSITYTSSRNSLWDLSASQDVVFNRNVMTTVYVTLNPDLSGFRFTTSEEEMDEENVINMGINTDGLIDIIVNPQD